MPPAILSLQLLRGAPPRFERGRCLRARFASSTCRRCADACPNNALACTDKLPVFLAEACTRCLRCQGACPAGAIGEPEELQRLIEEFGDHPHPVLGCSRPGVRAHARIPCFGLFDPEALLALAFLFPGGLTFNLTRCASCHNKPAVDALRDLRAGLCALPGFPADRLRLADQENEIVCREEVLSRREFFTCLRNRSAAAAGTALQRRQEPAAESYGAKRLSPGRHLLLMAMPLLPPPLRSAAENRFYPILAFGPECRCCTGCTGVCPTGALATSTGDPPRPVFDPTFCTACTACIGFCRHRARVLVKNPI